ncbi:MAG: 1,2-phenylacetyl-CoA epoxidase subunit PaaD [Paralcaligenes sp.]
MSAVLAADSVSVQQVLQWLALVPDPEIPVLSVVDLGIIRDVSWDGITCVVTITPTYSGCPAMQEISAGIVDTLKQNGVASVRIQTRLSPAWTTDWLTPAGHAALKGYGIAPPKEKAIDISGLARGAHRLLVPCPRCGSEATRLISQFGSTSCKALYRCSHCGEPFDYFKAH